MDKSVWEVVRVPEVYNRDSRGKMIITICADIFAAISKPNHPRHQKHREHTKHSLRLILSMLSMETIVKLIDDHEFEPEDGEQALEFLDQLIDSKLKDLEEIVYQPMRRLRRKSSRQRSSPEDWKIAGIIAAVFDFEVEAEEYVEDLMMTHIHQQPQS